MKLNAEVKKQTLGNDLKMDILISSGNIYDIYKDIIRVKQLYGDNYETSPANLFLRVEKEGNVYTTPLIGLHSPSKFHFTNSQAIYSGTFENVSYTVTISVMNQYYFFEVEYKATAKEKVQVYYGMDFAIADLYGIRSNEAYICQYIDHKAYETKDGYVVCSRQNQGQNFYLEQGAFSHVNGYSTDATQFFGLSYKKTQKIESLEKGKLANEIYQYECSYCALSLDETQDSNVHQAVFYGAFGTITDEITEPILHERARDFYLTKVKGIYDKEDTPVYSPVNPVVSFNNVFDSREMTASELEEYFPKRNLPEFGPNQELYSFFLDNHAYVTMPKKEMILERPTGNILVSGNYLDPENVLATTVYMSGIFQSQIVCGNTSFNKLMSNQRNFLGLRKISGERIFIKINGAYRLLQYPAAFENGLNYAKWFYFIEDDVLTITSYVSTRQSKTRVTIDSKLQKSYDFICTNEILMAQNEGEATPSIRFSEDNTECFFTVENAMVNRYENFEFRLKTSAPVRFTEDEILFEDNHKGGAQMLCMSFSGSHFCYTFVGDTFGVGITYEMNSFEVEVEEYIKLYANMLHHLQVELPGNRNVESINHLMYWYTHDMMVHYASPHGLEQYNGAAWGTRDVCQGPAEYFLATENFDVVRKILLDVYTHQFEEDGSWPQWFMFDRFCNIQEHSSHGDVIVWPARLLGLYLTSTGDESILEEEIPYMNMNAGAYSKEKYPLRLHLQRELDYIESHYIPGTHLSCYGGGDWDDTLQPANKEYAKNMASGWTVSLTYDMLRLISGALSDKYLKLKKYCIRTLDAIRNDYMKIIFNDEVPAGFVLFENGTVRKMIHPSDHVTNMSYRLLPLSRGVISEMFDEKQKNACMKTIHDHLEFPDGVRLMDRTVPYHGGKKTYFQRAETASNFGREISLQYCHAHIRYVESLAKINDADAFHSLMKINPIEVHENVKNALPRQRNSYYSSSDACFKTRYEAMKDFDKLRTQEIGVKSGWRVYSSGGGIFMNQLIQNIMGIKVRKDALFLDPCLSLDLDGLEVTWDYLNKSIKVKYVYTNEAYVSIDGKKLDIAMCEQKYKKNGYWINNDWLAMHSVIEIGLVK